MVDVALDPVTEMLLRIEGQKNLNSMQVIVLDATLRIDALRRAVRETLPQFPLLLSAPTADRTRATLNARAPEAAHVEEVDYTEDGDFDASNRSFRRFLTFFSRTDPIHWESEIPIRFRLIQDRRPGRKPRSCLVIYWSHAIADHHANTMLLETLMAAYAGLRSSSSVHSFCPLDEVFHSEPLSRQARAVVDVAIELARNRLSPPALPPLSRDASQGPIDFYHEILSDEWQRDIRRLAHAAGHTINTVITAALLRAVYRRRRDADRPAPSRDSRLVCAFGLRNLAGTKAARDFRNFVLMIRLGVPGTASSSELMHSIASQIRALKAGGIATELIKQEFVKKLLRRRWGRTLGLWLIGEALSSRMCYSNAGVIPGTFRTFGSPDLPIVDYVALGPIIAPLNFVLFTCELHGLLEMDAIYFTAAFDDFERRIVQPIKEELRRLLDEYDGGRSASRRGGGRLVQ